MLCTFVLYRLKDLCNLLHSFTCFPVYGFHTPISWNRYFVAVQLHSKWYCRLRGKQVQYMCTCNFLIIVHRQVSETKISFLLCFSTVGLLSSWSLTANKRPYQHYRTRHTSAQSDQALLNFQWTLPDLMQDQSILQMQNSKSLAAKLKNESKSEMG